MMWREWWEGAWPAVAVGVEVGVDAAHEGIPAAVDEAVAPLLGEEGVVELCVVVGQVWVVGDFGGDEGDLSAGFAEGRLRVVHGAGTSAGTSRARGWRRRRTSAVAGPGWRRAGEQHQGGVLVDLAGFVDQDGAVLLGAEALPVGEVAEVDGRMLVAGPAGQAELDERGRGLLASLDQFGRADLEELFHGG